MFFSVISILVLLVSNCVCDNSCGPFCTWTLSDGILTISGKGPMTRFDSPADVPWCRDRGLIKKVVIEPGIITIGDYAFYQSSRLASIDIPESVELFGSHSFYRCSNLVSGTIGSINWNMDVNTKTITFTGKGKTPPFFRNYDTSYDGYASNAPWNSLTESITTVVISEGIRSLGVYAFAGCSCLTSVTLPEGFSFLEEGLFYGCSNLASIDIPSTVLEIRKSAFGYCRSLTEVTIPSSVIYLGSSIFIGLSALERLNILSEKFFTEKDTFDCPRLLSGSIGSINWSLNENILKITGYGKMQGFYVDDDKHTCFNNSPWGLSSGSLEKIDISEGVTSIGNGLFSQCSKLTSVTIPSTVTSIGDYAFCGASELRTITLPHKLLTIGRYAFLRCTELESIIIPDAVTTIGEDAFRECSGLREIKIGVGITSINENTFNGCSKLTSLEIPRNVQYIDDHSFANCSSLVSVDIENVLIRLIISPFSNCTSITSGSLGQIRWSLDQISGTLSFVGKGEMTNFNYGLRSSPWKESSKKIKKVNIVDGITSIGNFAFSSCTSLEFISIPSSVRLIGWSAFVGCPQWKSGALGNISWKFDDMTGELSFKGKGEMPNFYANGVPWYEIRSLIETVVIEDGITSIGDYAFFGCENLVVVKIPSTVTAVGINANVDEKILSSDVHLIAACGASCVATFFEDKLVIEGSGSMTNFQFERNTPWFKYNVDISSITISNGITSIGAYSFRSFDKLTSILLPISVRSIEEYAFDGCSNLEVVTIQENVESIGDFAFYGCKSLKTISFPDGLKYIGGNAFERCYALKSVTIPNSIIEIGLSALVVSDIIYYHGANAPALCDGAFDEVSAIVYVSENYPSSVFCGITIVYLDEYKDGVRWMFDESDMSLYFTGTNKISIDGAANTAPWSRFTPKTIKIVVKTPLEHVTKKTFAGYPVLTELYFFFFSFCAIPLFVIRNNHLFYFFIGKLQINPIWLFNCLICRQQLKKCLYYFIFCISLFITFSVIFLNVYFSDFLSKY